ncbi:MAG: hypothetical protein R3D57_08615 [Hyphomicrobiaceae bacterium]
MSNGDHRNSDPLEMRIARLLRSGSISVKAGQVDDLVIEIQVAGELAREAQSAYRSWAHWRAINDRMESVELRRVVTGYTQNGLRTIRQAIARDAVLLAFRLSDPLQMKSDGETRVTLCRAAALLDDDSLSNRLLTRDGLLELGCPEIIVDAEIQANAQRVARIRESVVSDWNSQKPDATEFLELRLAIRPLRNRLAHAMLGGEFSPPIIDQISRFVDLTLDLATDYALLIAGKAVAAENARHHEDREAKLYWNTTFDSLLAFSKAKRNAAE